MALPTLRLKPNEDRRLRAGHLWVFSNEIDTDATPLSAFEPGDQVTVRDARGGAIGSAYLNPHSLIAGRLYAARPDVPLDRALIGARLDRALQMRERLYRHSAYRLIHGEGDLLPGLIVDRFGDVLSVQMTTAGMDRQRETVLELLVDRLRPRSVVRRDDVGVRRMEGLELGTGILHGEDPGVVEIEENEVRFGAPVLAGQKTGWFYDHRENRAAIRPWTRDARVLDLFSYAGAWSVSAAVWGAAEVVAIDSSAPALELVKENAARNRVEDRVRTMGEDAFDASAALGAENERFDIVVLDPPAFIKRKKDRKAGTKAYERINTLALRLLGPGGILVSASCSYHLEADELRRVVVRAARRAGKTLQLIAEGGQSRDHPAHPAIPETRYLKALTFRVLD